jgi:hypothetical protein
MAKNKTRRVDSKQSTGARRQRELLASSKCSAHGREAIRTTLLAEGKYKHECWECILTPTKKAPSIVSILEGGVAPNELMKLLLG